MRWLCTYMCVFFFFAESFVFVIFFLPHLKTPLIQNPRGKIKIGYVSHFQWPSSHRAFARTPRDYRTSFYSISNTFCWKPDGNRNRGNIHIFRNRESLCDNLTKNSLNRIKIIFVRTEGRTKRGFKSTLCFKNNSPYAIADVIR